MLGITMRVMRHAHPGGDVEERDALARDWPRFPGTVLPREHLLYLPNIGAEITEFAAGGGLIFSGGEDWGLVPPRDTTEAALALVLDLAAAPPGRGPGFAPHPGPGLPRAPHSATMPPHGSPRPPLARP